MKLDRNIEGNGGRGKYALLKLRNLEGWPDYFGTPRKDGAIPAGLYNAIKTLENAEILDWGTSDSESEFFVIRLKDKYSASALFGYADAADRDGEHEFAAEIREMAFRAGPAHPDCKKPD